MKNIYFIAILGWISAAGAHGQSVAWSNPGQIPPQAAVQLDLVFTDCAPKGEVNLPKVAGLQFSGTVGRATSFSMINFRASSSTTLSYTVQAERNGRAQIPSFEVMTDKGRMSVPSLALDVTAAAANQPRQANPFSPNFPFPPNPFQNQTPNPGSQVVPPDAVKAMAEAEPRRPYVGQVFDVNYRVVMTGNRSGRVKTTPLWDVQNFTAEAWDRGQQIGPGGNQGLQFHTRAMVPKAGLFELPSIRQKLDIDTAVGGRSFFFTAPGSVEVEAVAAPVSLNVEALPPNPPAGFQGAVGQFALESKLVPEQVGEGEPVTWTLTLRGTGNWPMGVELPGRVVPKEIRTIQPKLRREFNGTEIFTGAIVEDLVMIPTQSGEFQLPPVKFVFFDPKKKAYETIEAKPPKVLVSRQTSGLALPPAPASGSAGVPTGDRKAGKVPAPASTKPLVYGAPGLPREPLEGTGVGFGPLPTWIVLVALLLPWGILVLVWSGWAKNRAVQTDAERIRKESLRAWKESVQRLRVGNQSRREEQENLLLWQRSVAAVFGVEEATPAWAELSQAVSPLREEDRDELEKCWERAEQVLYGRDAGLNGDWCEKAALLAARIDLPRLRFWDSLRPRNLWPWITLFALAGPWVVLGQESPPTGAAGKKESPIALYREGNFEKAGQIWGEAVRKDMSDPVTRNNLGLAWYQIGDKERALANALSAYLISPQTETVGWNASIFAGAADQLDPVIRRLLEGSWASWLTARAGVLAWQIGLVAGSAGVALGIGLWLASGYFAGRRKVLFPAAVAVGCVGLLGFVVAGSALGMYGRLADARAVMIVDFQPLRSIPTEVETQAEKGYPPGSIARLEKSFLGWSKVRMPNQDTGWIRTENIVPLY